MIAHAMLRAFVIIIRVLASGLILGIIFGSGILGLSKLPIKHKTFSKFSASLFFIINTFFIVSLPKLTYSNWSSISLAMPLLILIDITTTLLIYRINNYPRSYWQSKQ